MTDEFRTIYAGDAEEIKCTDFEDGVLFIRDAEMDTIMLTKEQFKELYKQIFKEGE